MACVQLMKLSTANSQVKLGCFCSEFGSWISARSSLRVRNPGTRLGMTYCKADNGENQRKSEEPPESLFTKELRRRGITPTFLDENDSSNDRGAENFRDEDGGWSYSRRNGTKNDAQIGIANQLETSRALNSEGLEGLIPRAKILLRLGAAFFLGFWPLILATVASFSALYLYFGSEFIHIGSNTSPSLPQYVDPYRLLENERMYPTSLPN